MVVINDGKNIAVYCRTNRHVQWIYAEYGGRYETAEQALAAVKKHYGEQRVEYLLDDGVTGNSTTGFVN